MLDETSRKPIHHENCVEWAWKYWIKNLLAIKFSSNTIFLHPTGFFLFLLFFRSVKSIQHFIQHGIFVTLGEMLNQFNKAFIKPQQTLLSGGTYTVNNSGKLMIMAVGLGIFITQKQSPRGVSGFELTEILWIVKKWPDGPLKVIEKYIAFHDRDTLNLNPVFCKKGALENFTKFTWKYLCRDFFFNTVTGL